jgi:hypothetical protein
MNRFLSILISAVSGFVLVGWLASPVAAAPGGGGIHDNRPATGGGGGLGNFHLATGGGGGMGNDRPAA